MNEYIKSVKKELMRLGLDERTSLEVIHRNIGAVKYCFEVGSYPYYAALEVCKAEFPSKSN